MDLSKKSSPYYILALPNPLHPAEQYTHSSSFAMEVKVEYSEEDIIKEESADVHVDPQSLSVHRIFLNLKLLIFYQLQLLLNISAVFPTLLHSTHMANSTLLIHHIHLFTPT